MSCREPSGCLLLRLHFTGSQLFPSSAPLFPELSSSFFSCPLTGCCSAPPQAKETAERDLRQQLEERRETIRHLVRNTQVCPQSRRRGTPPPRRLGSTYLRAERTAPPQCLYATARRSVSERPVYVRAHMCCSLYSSSFSGLSFSSVTPVFVWPSLFLLGGIS